MATKYWVGGAAAVAQVQSGTIDTVDATPANNTYTVTIGSATVSVAGNTDANTTAADLVTALLAATDPRFTAVTWSNPSGSTVQGTAAIAGVPFVAALSVTGAGTGTVTDFSVTTANEGPASASTPGNYSDGALPSASDTLVFKDTSKNLSYDLEAITDDLNVVIHQTYTGRIGLRRNSFATSADGATAETGIEDNRPTHFKLPISSLEIGVHNGPGSPAGSVRIKINNSKSGASTTIIYDTNNSGENQTPAVHLLSSNASADVYINGCPGGVGLGVDEPGETATFGAIQVAAGPQQQVFIGDGVTYTTLEGKSGSILADSAATVTKVENNGADITLSGAYLVTTLENNAGVTFANNAPSAGAAITNANLNGGVVDASQDQQARTWTTVTMGEDATLIYDSAHLTVSTLAQPAGLRTLSTT